MANETGIVGNPYTGGNVAFNTTPFTQFYINTLARQQAKEEAAAKEYQSQAKLLTPSGMRGQDVNALMGAKNEWQSDWYKNKDLIQHPDRDNGEAWNKNNELYNKASNIPTVSKDRAKGNEFISKILSDPTKSKLLTDDAIERIRQHNLPINDPNHRSISETEFESPLFNPKPLSPTEDISLTNLINTKFKGEKTKSVPGITDQNTFKREDTNTYTPKSSELPEYLQMGERLYQNGQLAGEVNKLISEHAHGVVNPVYEGLNTIYKQNFGKDISHPEEAATAMLLSKNTNYGDKKETVIDDAAKLSAQEKIRQRAYNQAEKDRRLRQQLSFNNQKTLQELGTVNNVENGIDEVLNKNPGGSVPVTAIPSDAREYIIESVNKGKSDKSDPNKLNIIKADDGSYRVLDMRKKGEVVGTFPANSINLYLNKNQKVKQQILKTTSGKQKISGF